MKPAITARRGRRPHLTPEVPQPLKQRHSFKDRLVEFKNQHGYTAREVGLALGGVSVRTVEDWLQGQRPRKSMRKMVLARIESLKQ